MRGFGVSYAPLPWSWVGHGSIWPSVASPVLPNNVGDVLKWELDYRIHVASVQVFKPPSNPLPSFISIFFNCGPIVIFGLSTGFQEFIRLCFYHITCNKLTLGQDFVIHLVAWASLIFKECILSVFTICFLCLIALCIWIISELMLLLCQHHAIKCLVSLVNKCFYFVCSLSLCFRICGGSTREGWSSASWLPKYARVLILSSDDVLNLGVQKIKWLCVELYLDPI
jgi:hypothetical protein